LRAGILNQELLCLIRNLKGHVWSISSVFLFERLQHATQCVFMLATIAADIDIAASLQVR
jgi:hypothetical protein